MHVRRPLEVSDKGLCHFPFCDRPRVYKEFCKGHQRQRREGKPLTVLGPRKNAPLAERIEFYSMPITETGCIIWTGSVGLFSGYGRINFNGKSELAHRMAWKSAYGSVTDETLIDHRCGVKLCVNVDHLRQASNSQNSQHRVKLGANNTSGYRNVYWRKSSDSWYVSMKIKGQSFYFGSYQSIEEAAEVASQKRKEIYGEFSGVDR